MNATNPPPFSELLAKATPGQCQVHPNKGKGGDRLVQAGPRNPIAKIYSGDANGSEECDANAELIVRLLNFAQAGGVDGLEGAASALEAMPVNPDSPYWKYRQGQVDKVRTMLAILDGKAL